MSASPDLKPRLAVVVALGLVGAAFLLRVGVFASNSGSTRTDITAATPDRWVTSLLVAAGAICVAGLAIRRAPRLALGATVLAGVLGSIEITAAARAWEPAANAGEWVAISMASGVAAVAATALAAAFAMDAAAAAGGRTRSWTRGPAAAAIVVVAAVAAWALGAAVGEGSAVPRDLTVIRIAARVAIVLASSLALLGVALAGWAVGRSAIARSGSDETTLRQALVEELVPVLGADRRRVATLERQRLAAELHARVLPDLRIAAAGARLGGAPPGSSTEPEGVLGAGDRVGAALESVEAMMAERHSVVLESFGLVAALEELAERTESRSNVRVSIHPADNPRGREAGSAATVGFAGPVRPPGGVERAAFRIAELALDNATRHAAGAAVDVQVATTDPAVSLRISDDGPGLAAAVAGTTRGGGRGLRDMRAEAAAVRATLEVGARDDGNGTVVAFTWRRR
ncbi:MAG: ATP-binding protein [Candidatus Limnocylindrales bacterium]